ncbi:16802_t:CDS:2 [Gigaspora margarita]|uniref:16802_t:CDS:1 n=1 Tax=Gigaspora margarita TaxID=4874 RepID=A0ABN7V223_GIGMA|nr:16802_t:CDS:2 [Gigaspora margarita]
MEQERVENTGPLQNNENRFDDADPVTLITQELLHAVLREFANTFREASTEPGHISHDYISEWVPSRSMPPRNQSQNPNQNLALTSSPNQGNIVNNPPVPISTQSQNVNLCDLNDTGYQTEGKDVFVLLLSHHQLYSTQRPKRNQKKSESQVEERLQTNPPIAPAPVLPLVEVTPLPDRPPLALEVPQE